MEERKLIRENERLDDLQNGYMLIQDPSQFCFGIDAVLLSWFAKVKPGEQVGPGRIVKEPAVLEIAPEKSGIGHQARQKNDEQNAVQTVFH